MKRIENLVKVYECDFFDGAVIDEIRVKLNQTINQLNNLTERLEETEKIAFHASVELDRLAQVESTQEEPDKKSDDYIRGYNEAISILEMEKPS